MYMNPISTVPHSPLTQDDITRLPAGATGVQPKPTNAAPDEFVPAQPKKKSSFWKKAIITVVVLAALAVGAKHFCKDFLKVDAANPKWLDPVKKGINTVADWVEYPFIAIKNMFSGKAAEEAGKAATEAGKAATETAGKAADAAASAAADAGKAAEVAAEAAKGAGKAV